MINKKVLEKLRSNHIYINDNTIPFTKSFITSIIYINDEDILNTLNRLFNEGKLNNAIYLKGDNDISLMNELIIHNKLKSVSFIFDKVNVIPNNIGYNLIDIYKIKLEMPLALSCIYKENYKMLELILNKGYVMPNLYIKKVERKMSFDLLDKNSNSTIMEPMDWIFTFLCIGNNNFNRDLNTGKFFINKIDPLLELIDFSFEKYINTVFDNESYNNIFHKMDNFKSLFGFDFDLQFDHDPSEYANIMNILSSDYLMNDKDYLSVLTTYCSKYLRTEKLYKFNLVNNYTTVDLSNFYNKLITKFSDDPLLDKNLELITNCFLTILKKNKFYKSEYINKLDHILAIKEKYKLNLLNKESNDNIFQEKNLKSTNNKI